MKAVVKLTVGGHPYNFVVDSGAAGTVIDARIARRLGLRNDGPPREFAPLGCRTSTQPVAIRDWGLGQLHLSASTMFTQTLLIPHALPGIQLAGLLGSDVLSHFGLVTVDFTHLQPAPHSRDWTSIAYDRHHRNPTLVDRRLTGGATVATVGINRWSTRSKDGSHGFSLPVRARGRRRMTLDQSGSRRCGSRPGRASRGAARTVLACLSTTATGLALIAGIVALKNSGFGGLAYQDLEVTQLVAAAAGLALAALATAATVANRLRVATTALLLWFLADFIWAYSTLAELRLGG